MFNFFIIIIYFFNLIFFENNDFTDVDIERKSKKD